MLAHKLQFAPQPVDLSPARLVEQEPTQRLVFAAVQEDAALSVSRDDRLKEDRRREESTKLRRRPRPFGGDARMHDLRGMRVAHFSFGDRLSQIAAAACGTDQERFNGGRFRTRFVEAHIGAEKPRQRKRLLQFCRQFRQIDDDLGTGSRDESRLWHRSPLRVMAEFESRCLLDDRRQFWMLRKHQRRTVTTFQSQPVPDHEGVGLSWQRNHTEEQFTGGALHPLERDHATQILPGGKAIANREGRILPVVALKQLVLRGLDRRQDRSRIGGCLPPLFSNVVEQCRSRTGIRQISGRTAQIGQRLPQVWSRDMRQLE